MVGQCGQGPDPLNLSGHPSRRSTGLGWGWVGDIAGSVSPGPPGKSFRFAGSDHQALLGPEGTLAHSTATLRILASMPSRTIGEWDPVPSAPALTPVPGLGFPGRSVSLKARPFQLLPHPVCYPEAQYRPVQPAEF